MNESQKKILLRIAKDTVCAIVKDSPPPNLPEVQDAELTSNRGCFVTLKNGEELRGCIGQFVSEQPLIELVGQMAQASTSSDPRFLSDPITEKELEHLDIEISVLSPLVRTDNPLGLRLGVDGIYIKKGCLSGCFLPQVAQETGWSKEQFLSYCCSHKAGLPAHSWKDPKTEVYLFTADVFGAALRDI